MINPLLLGLLGLMVAVLIGKLLYDKFYAIKDVIRILLFEKVGDEKAFVGYRKGMVKQDDKLGVYILINREKFPITNVKQEDFFFDYSMNKALMVCKYAKDDYRPFSRMDKSVWGRIENKFNDETQEEEQDLVFYDEPLGVDQPAREAMRFNAAFRQRMDELRSQKEGFFEKYGALMGVGVVAIVLIIGLVQMTNSHTKLMEKGLEEFGESAADYKAAIQDPTWVDNIIKKLERDKVEDNTPKS